MLPSLDDMNLRVFVSIAEIVIALAVTLSLIVLVISIRQNTRSQKALVVNSLAAAIPSINIPTMDSDVLGSALSKATTDWSSATRQERIVAHYFLFSFFKLLENAWFQQKAGILWWHGREQAYSPEFQKYLSETKPPQDLGSLSELFDCVRP